MSRRHLTQCEAIKAIDAAEKRRRTTMARQGQRIKTVEALAKIADANDAVIVAQWQNASPARFVMCMHAAQVVRLIRHGVYRLRKKPKASARKLRPMPF